MCDGPIIADFIENLLNSFRYCFRTFFSPLVTISVTPISIPHSIFTEFLYLDFYFFSASFYITPISKHILSVLFLIITSDILAGTLCVRFYPLIPLHCYTFRFASSANYKLSVMRKINKCNTLLLEVNEIGSSLKTINKTMSKVKPN